MAEEKIFENRIKKFLDEHNIWHVKFFGNGFTRAGIPDILACVNGKFVAIEVKAEKGVISELQKHNIQKIKDAGGVAIVVRPSQFDDLKKLILLLNDNNITENDRIRALQLFED